MTKKDIKPCSSCRWCKITSVSDTPACFVECKRHYTIGKVDGYKRYAKCTDWRETYPDCPDWEQGGLKGFIQRLKARL